jgi:hypothetical protein
MRALTGLTAVLVTLLAGPAAAQTGDPISQAIRQAWDDAKGNLRQSAELIPEADLGFKPTDQVRTFGQILAHVAGANYVFCSAAKAEKSPFTEEHFEKTAKTKAEITKAVNDSIAYCDAAFKALTDKSAAESIAMPFGMGNRPRVSESSAAVTRSRLRSHCPTTASTDAQRSASKPSACAVRTRPVGHSDSSRSRSARSRSACAGEACKDTMRVIIARGTTSMLVSHRKVLRSAFPS